MLSLLLPSHCPLWPTNIFQHRQYCCTLSLCSLGGVMTIDHRRMPKFGPNTNTDHLVGNLTATHWPNHLNDHVGVTTYIIARISPILPQICRLLHHICPICRVSLFGRFLSPLPLVATWHLLVIWLSRFFGRFSDSIPPDWPPDKIAGGNLFPKVGRLCFGHVCETHPPHRFGTQNPLNFIDFELLP